MSTFMENINHHREKFSKRLFDAGHVLRTDEETGEIDWVSMCDDVGFHNGPTCVKCHMSWCEHCENKNIFQCDG